MEQRELEVTITSAQGLKNVSTFGKMTPYAVAWVYSNMKVSTPIDPQGGVNPTWNARLKLIVEQRILDQPDATLNIDIYSHGSFSNKHVGSCSVPLSHLLRKDSKGAGAKFMSFQVCRPSGRIQGTLNLSLKLGDVYQPSAMPGPSVAQPTEAPNNNNNKPITAYPPGYNQAGGSQYPQYPPQYPQYYPPVMGPQAPYYPPAGPYAVPPPPPRRTGLFGGGGFGPGLLGGALGGLLLGEALGGGFGGGGFGGGGCGGGGCGGGGCGG